MIEACALRDRRPGFRSKRLATVSSSRSDPDSRSAPTVEGPTLSTHVVQFCDDERVLTVAAAACLAEGITVGQPAIAFTTPAHREGLAAHLRELGLDVGYLEAQSRLTILDARATLAAFLVDGMPDARKFAQTVGSAVERLHAANERTVVRAFGEMVNLLWHDGNTTAAISLEAMWNGLAATYPISLLCTYAGGKFLAAAGRADR